MTAGLWSRVGRVLQSQQPKRQREPETRPLRHPASKPKARRRAARRVSFFSQDRILWPHFQASSALVDTVGGDPIDDLESGRPLSSGKFFVSLLPSALLKGLLPCSRSRGRCGDMLRVLRKGHLRLHPHPESLFSMLLHPFGRDWTSSCIAAARPGREPEPSIGRAPLHRSLTRTLVLWQSTVRSLLLCLGTCAWS